MLGTENALDEMEQTFSYGEYQMDFTRLSQAIMETGDFLLNKQKSSSKNIEETL